MYTSGILGGQGHLVGTLCCSGQNRGPRVSSISPGPGTLLPPCPSRPQGWRRELWSSLQEASGATICCIRAQGINSGLGAALEVTVRGTKPPRRCRSPKRTLTTPGAPLKHAGGGHYRAPGWAAGNQRSCTNLLPPGKGWGNRTLKVNVRLLCLLCPP